MNLVTRSPTEDGLRIQFEIVVLHCIPVELDPSSHDIKSLLAAEHSRFSIIFVKKIILTDLKVFNSNFKSRIDSEFLITNCDFGTLFIIFFLPEKAFLFT
jgi:hypothetical protein